MTNYYMGMRLRQAKKASGSVSVSFFGGEYGGGIWGQTGRSPILGDPSGDKKAGSVATRGAGPCFHHPQQRVPCPFSRSLREGGAFSSHRGMVPQVRVRSLDANLGGLWNDEDWQRAFWPGGPPFIIMDNLGLECPTLSRSVRKGGCRQRREPALLLA
jgi:hypothetical protein